MKQCKKMNYLFIVFAMMMLCPQQSWADRETVVFWNGNFGFSWSTKNKDVKLANCEATGEVVIPATATFSGKTYPVQTIATHCFDGLDGITSISIPNCIHWIDNNAFDNCSNLNKVTFEDGPDSIQVGYSKGYFFDDQIFYGCSKLTDVYLGRTIVIRNTGEDAPFEDMICIKKVVIGPYVKNIPKKLFYDTKLTTIDFTNATGLKTIGDNAFSHSSASTITTYHNIVEELNMVNCTNLTSIGECAFYNIIKCDITLPESITSLGAECFESASAGVGGNLQYQGTVDLSRCVHLKVIPEKAFQGASGSIVRHLSLPEGLTTIEASAFKDNAITELTIPSTVTYIGDDAFQRYETDATAETQPWGIKELTLPGTEASKSTKITNVDDENFKWVVTLNLDRNITGINNEKVFPAAQKVKIGSENGIHVNFLQSGAFTESSDLKSVTVYWNTKDELDNIFTNGKAYSTYFPSKSVTLNVPACTEPFYKNADVWKGFSVTSGGMNSYKRDLSSKWGTLVVPFDVTSNSDIQYYAFEDYYPNDENLVVTPVDKVEANTPCFFKRTSDSVSEINISGEYKEPQAMEPELTVSEYIGGNMELYGSYYYGDTSINDANYYYLAKDQLWYAENGFTLPQNRAYLKFSNNGAKPINLIATDELTNGIADVPSDDSEKAESAIYNLAGQSVSKNTKGIVIENGKKYINK